MAAAPTITIIHGLIDKSPMRWHRGFACCFQALRTRPASKPIERR